MYIVTGVSGNTGKVVADTLLSQGHPVTVVVRDAAKGESWRAKGATVAVADLADSAALTQILTGAQGAYLLSPPNNTAEDFLADRAHFINSLATAVKASGIPHIVFLSSVGAHQPTGTGPIRSLHYAEQALANAANGVTFLRASYFLDNWFGSFTGEALHNFLTPGRAIPMISTTDIGRFVAAHLLQPVTGPRTVEIAGPADYTPEDIAAAFGPNVQLLTHPIDAVIPTFLSIGFSANMAGLYKEMIEGVNSGHVSAESAPVRGTVTAAEALKR